MKFPLKKRLIFDGGTGTLLQSMGLAAGELPELWNILHPDRIAAVHRAYFAAGSDVVCTNTFGANLLKFDGLGGRFELREVVRAALETAVSEKNAAGGERYVALDIGPLGKMLAPFGDIDFEDALKLFAETVRLGAEYGADLVICETFADTYEAKAALLAVKENCSLPSVVSCAFDKAGHLMTGADPSAVVALFEGLGADMIGANCGVGPDLLFGTARALIDAASVPVLIKPNAGLPRSVNGKTVFDVSAQNFASDMAVIASLGASALGGCCGTTPDYIRAVISATEKLPYTPPVKKTATVVSSYSHAVVIGDRPVLVGERINPTGKKALKDALRSEDMAYILSQGTEQAAAGAHILDVNVGLPGTNEPNMMKRVVAELQSVIDLPLQIDSSDPAAIEAALRVCNGKPLINSVNGKTESMEAIFPLAKKYGGVVVGLTLDESGIPDTAEGRAAIAERIIDTAAKYGIDRKNIIIDTLTLTVATDSSAAAVTLDALRQIKRRFGVSTCLGVSNVSFGLPAREDINSVFFTLALGAGLDAAIMNPLSGPMMNSYRSYLALTGADASCADYIANAQNAPSRLPTGTAATVIAAANVQPPTADDLYGAVVRGLRGRASTLARSALIDGCAPMDIINDILIPALGEVGEGFGTGTVYLPQLLMSAEAAGEAFAVLRASMEGGGASEKKEKIILATVRGDIHDIGKNIVHALLENYNYEIIDLGRDVPPSTVAQTAVRENVRLVGLSALMTTTVPSMEETVRAVRAAKPDCAVMVGGAVLTQEYADMIGADHYSPDAMDAVRFAESFFGRA